MGRKRTALTERSRLDRREQTNDSGPLNSFPGSTKAKASISGSADCTFRCSQQRRICEGWRLKGTGATATQNNNHHTHTHTHTRTKFYCNSTARPNILGMKDVDGKSAFKSSNIGSRSPEITGGHTLDDCPMHYPSQIPHVALQCKDRMFFVLQYKTITHVPN